MSDKGQGRTGLTDNGLLRVNLSTQILCIALVTPVVILRLIIRKRLKQPFSVEDDGFAGGADKMAYLSQDESDTTFKISYASTIIYAPLAMAVKVTLLLVLAKIYRPFRGAIAVYVILALNVLYYFLILFVKAFICKPASEYWTKPGASGKCLDRPAVIIADSLISVISDIAILVLPVVFTWPLQMRLKVKFKVVSLLGLGGIAVGFSLYRLVLLIVDGGNTPDQSILFMRVLLSGNAEAGIGLICACLPALSKYISHCRQNQSRQPSQQDQKGACGELNPIFDGSSNCNSNGTPRASLHSHMETRIWRSDSAVDGAGTAPQSEISGSTAGRHSPLAIRTNVMVHRESENNPEYSPA